MRPIVLFTDFGWNGPYVGHMKARLWMQRHRGPVIDLMHDAPAFDPACSGLLLAAHIPYMPHDAVIMAVIDPGVGSARRGLAIQVGGRWLVGPDNGLFDPLLNGTHKAYTLKTPDTAAPTFHGRGIFAPAAAALAQGQVPLGTETVVTTSAPPETDPRVIYIDAYGNVMTSILPGNLGEDGLTVCDIHFPKARTFSDVANWQPFCYINSIGLVELAVNCGSAAGLTGLKIGDFTLYP